MNFIETTCQQIVSPPKLRYSSLDLGQLLTPFGRRFDFNTNNKFQKTLKCSLYVPKAVHHSKMTVIYLHSMNGSRLESLSYLDCILEMGLFFCSFDFSGCGNSQGDKISFGANEKYDVQTIVEHLNVHYGLNRFILWGRSMGAVAALKYQELLTSKFTAIQIHGMILDSPFRSLRELIVELGVSRVKLPRFMIEAGYHLIKKTLQKKGNFDIEELELMETINSINQVPLMFLASEIDTTINSTHSEALFEAYPYRDKRLVYFTALHNQSRNGQYVQNVYKFIEERVARANEKRTSIRYKRIRLEEEALKMAGNERGLENNQCECEFFTFKGPRASRL